MLRTNIFLKYKNNYFIETGSYLGHNDNDIMVAKNK